MEQKLEDIRREVVKFLLSEGILEDFHTTAEKYLIELSLVHEVAVLLIFLIRANISMETKSKQN